VTEIGIDQCHNDDGELGAAAAFHGHLGPYLVIGLKAGSLANSILGKDPFRVVANVSCPPKPPHSCIIDGVQFSTGCTMGKNNITLTPAQEIVIVFRKGSEALELRIKRQVADRITSVGREGSEALSRELYGMVGTEIFEVKRG